MENFHLSEDRRQMKSLPPFQISVLAVEEAHKRNWKVIVHAMAEESVKMAVILGGEIASWEWLINR